MRGGLPNDFITEGLRLSLKDLSDPLLKAIDELNKRTHVRPETILAGGTTVRHLFHQTLADLASFLKSATEARRDVTDATADVMHTAVFENLISDTVQNLDEISTHTVIDGHNINSITDTYLDSTHVTFRIDGDVEVDLQYGSNSDVANDLSFRQDDSYPYTATVTG